VPLFFVNNTIEKVDGVRPYSPLELAGRNIYIREGCYLCHSQMIRPFRDETERYGHYSLAAESMYDHPFQWGSKRTGPDLARVGGKYTNQWHVEHLTSPRSVVPESVMPRYFFLKDNLLKFEDPAAHMAALKIVGVPYTDEDMAKAKDDLQAQATGTGDVDGLKARYPKAVMGDFDGNPDKLTEMDALISYLQMLGTLVDFSTYKPEAR
jgi:cytochrome c oxidase cbb3-type subunit 2